jgi:hypothetical protein
MAKPSYEDADIMLRLAQTWPTESSNWIWSDEFNPDYRDFRASNREGGHGPAHVHAVLNWFETIGTLYKYELINEDLLFDWLAADAVWTRVKGYAIGLREESGNRRLYENFEAMAEAQRAWVSSRERNAA